MKKVLLLIILIILIVPLNIEAFNIKSKAAILYNLNDDEILYEENAYKKTAIASLTKIMTALVALDNITDVNDKVVMTSDMYATLREKNAATAGFKVGEQVTYLDLLYALLLPSGAEAAQGLAITTSGSIPNFVNKMNLKAQELGLKDTHFANPIGLDDPNNYSTPYDVSIMLKTALNNPLFYQIFTSKSYVTSNQKHKFKATVVNKKIDSSFIDGSKTGFTYDAGLCLASLAHHADVKYMLITLNAPYNDRTNHIADHKIIYDYYFANFDNRQIVDDDQLLVTVTNMNQSYDFYSDEKVVKYLSTNCQIKNEYKGKKKIGYHDKIGTRIGTYFVKCGDDIIYEKDIVITDAIYHSVLHEYLIYFSYALLGIVSAIFIIVFIVRRCRRAMAK